MHQGHLVRVRARVRVRVGVGVGARVGALVGVRVGVEVRGRGRGSLTVPSMATPTNMKGRPMPCRSPSHPPITGPATHAKVTAA